MQKIAEAINSWLMTDTTVIVTLMMKAVTITLLLLFPHGSDWDSGASNLFLSGYWPLTMFGNRDC